LSAGGSAVGAGAFEAYLLASDVEASGDTFDHRDRDTGHAPGGAAVAAGEVGVADFPGAVVGQFEVAGASMGIGAVYDAAIAEGLQVSVDGCFVGSVGGEAVSDLASGERGIGVGEGAEDPEAGCGAAEAGGLEDIVRLFRVMGAHFLLR
jgi:hypothetical protein